MEKSVVCDLDCTICSGHLYHFINNVEYFHSKWGTKHKKETVFSVSKLMNSDNWEDNLTSDNEGLIISLIWGGYDRIAQIRKFLEKLKLSKVKLSIASNGASTSIISCLKLAKLDDLFDNDCIYGVTDKRSTYASKAHFIYKMFSEKGIKVYYIDDDPKDYRCYKEDYYNHPITYIGGDIGLEKDMNGLSETMMDQITVKILEDT